jgi:hypothetical protein
MAQSQSSLKGVVDLVFLIDVTGSMSPCIDALRQNIGLFIDYLVSGDGEQNQTPVKDWRAKAVGYRDIEVDTEWFVDAPFVRDVTQLKAQLSALAATGGGDEPETLLDALYRVINMGQSEVTAQVPDGNRWRARGNATRVIIVFTDASFKETMTIPEAMGGTWQDISTACHNNRIYLNLFAPNMECYQRLSEIQNCEWEVVEGPGGPQLALAQYTSDRTNFAKALKMLAKTVSKSAEVSLTL